MCNLDGDGVPRAQDGGDCKKKDGAEEADEEEGDQEDFVKSAYQTAVVHKGMRPSEFWELHPQEFWWMAEAWSDQDRKRRNPNGLSAEDYDELKDIAMRAKEMHKRGEWDPMKGFSA